MSKAKFVNCKKCPIMMMMMMMGFCNPSPEQGTSEFCIIWSPRVEYYTEELHPCNLNQSADHREDSLRPPQGWELHFENCF